LRRSISINKSVAALLIIIGSALAARLVVGILYFNPFDTFWYREWAVNLPKGFFSVYSRAEAISLDDPPLYLFCLYLTGLAYQFFGFECSNEMQMFLMKFWPILFDTLCILTIYFAARRRSETAALFCAALWGCNPSAFYNSAFWGQTDGLMALLLVWAFLLAEKRPVVSCFMFAVAGLTKYQSLFFTPVLLLYIFRRHGIKRLLLGISAAAATVAAVFLPFMIGARNPLLFFDVYLAGLDTYPYCTFNAYNIYGWLGLNCVEDSGEAFLGLSYADVNTIVTVIILMVIVFLFLFGRRINIYVGGLLIMQSIFMLTTRMHERYQIIVLPFALLAYATTKNIHFAVQFAALTILTLINQAVILFNVNQFIIFDNLDGIMTVVSFINLIVFIHTLYASINYFFKEEGYDLFETTPPYSATAEE